MVTLLLTFSARYFILQDRCTKRALGVSSLFFLTFSVFVCACVYTLGELLGSDMHACLMVPFGSEVEKSIFYLASFVSLWLLW